VARMATQIRCSVTFHLIAVVYVVRKFLSKRNFNIRW